MVRIVLTIAHPKAKRMRAATKRIRRRRGNDGDHYHPNVTSLGREHIHQFVVKLDFTPHTNLGILIAKTECKEQRCVFVASK